MSLSNTSKTLVATFFMQVQYNQVCFWVGQRFCGITWFKSHNYKTDTWNFLPCRTTDGIKNRNAAELDPLWSIIGWVIRVIRLMTVGTFPLKISTLPLNMSLQLSGFLMHHHWQKSVINFSFCQPLSHLIILSCWLPPQQEIGLPPRLWRHDDLQELGDYAPPFFGWFLLVWQLLTGHFWIFPY